MKLKTLVAALGLVAALPSFATIANNSPSGAGEAFLVVFDTTNGSYTLDLGITFNQFLATPAGTSTLATLSGSNWNSFLAVANQATWQYAVVDARSNNAGNNATLISTVSADDLGSIPVNFTSANIDAAVGQVNNYQQAVSVTGTHGGLLSPAINGDSYNPFGTGGYYLTTAMDSFNGFGYINSVNVGTVAAVELVQRLNNGLTPPTEVALGTAAFGLTAGSYQLSYTVAAVPEPTGLGMALAGFGIFGLIASRRRNRR